MPLTHNPCWGAAHRHSRLVRVLTSTMGFDVSWCRLDLVLHGRERTEAGRCSHSTYSNRDREPERLPAGRRAHRDRSTGGDRQGSVHVTRRGPRSTPPPPPSSRPPKAADWSALAGALAGRLVRP